MPVVGGLIIGLMARFGSEKIRGHGIPEAIEAILIGGSRMSPKVAVLKPLSSAISIGSGGPFGAEGPIIMTGGACGSIFAQIFHLTSAERKTLLVAGAAGGMAATFGTPLAAVLLAVELLLFEWKPRSFMPVAISAAVAGAVAAVFFRARFGAARSTFTGPCISPSLDFRRSSTVCVGLSVGVLSLLLTGRIRSRRRISSVADPLDVVADDRRSGRRHRRLFRAAGIGRRLRRDRRLARTANTF